MSSERLVWCPACGWPVPRELMRRIPDDGAAGNDPDDVCASCLGDVTALMTQTATPTRPRRLRYLSRLQQRPGTVEGRRS
jgi:hypothetical protein